MLEMVRVLVEHGADPCTEHLDKTPCEIAQSLGHMEIHKYLKGKLFLGILLWIRIVLIHFDSFFLPIQLWFLKGIETIYSQNLESHPVTPPLQHQPRGQRE